MPSPAHALVRILAAGLLAGSALAASAQPLPAPTGTDPDLEARVIAIADELRCVVCQNETLAASQAALAVDLREQIRQQLRQGRTPDEIRAFMVSRFGQFVLYRPPMQPTTWLLWAGPFALLLLGAWLVRSRLRPGAPSPTRPLTEQDLARARALLARGQEAG